MLPLAEALSSGVCRINGDAQHQEKMFGIRAKLQDGKLPLDDAEAILLWEMATGEAIVRRKRCPECKGTGKVVHDTPRNVKRLVPCPTCKGEGYVQ